MKSNIKLRPIPSILEFNATLESFTIETYKHFLFERLVNVSLIDMDTEHLKIDLKYNTIRVNEFINDNNKQQTSLPISFKIKTFKDDIIFYTFWVKDRVRNEINIIAFPAHDHQEMKLFKLYYEMYSIYVSQKQKYNTLSRREKEIASYISQGLSNKEIAELLFLSAHTIKNHKNNIMHKLEVNTSFSLLKTVYAYEFFTRELVMN
ncbi:response regulator transcription factor [Flammeovirga agarivorans]|uniref:Helix-turn-helix transcriptional regulator n=1 Tax=Flammeovirga agarivorans TaxID=2726742 RepID=A0A7X8SNP9_9BACT|nr:helix-turn-helix transcriptional regulator [Flammeovirga agarivorans]NLR93487.1 helix-turn-helix transcriptional regulator [Flammeovirga agarivorans]